MTNPGVTIKPLKFSFTLMVFYFTILDIYRHETCFQIALAIKDEVEDLEKAGVTVIQIDEAALREGLPLRNSEQKFYLDWAVHAFRITNCGVQDTTQVICISLYCSFPLKEYFLPVC